MVQPEELGSMFEPVGISEIQERLYRLILQHPGVALTSIAEVASLPRRHVQEAARSLEKMGLVSRPAGTRRGYSAAPPEVAVEALILRRQEELERCRLAAIELGRQSREVAQSLNPLEVVEVVTGREAVARRFEHMLRTAKHDVMVLTKPPFAVALDESESNERSLMERGVRARGITDPDALALPGFLTRVERLVAAGEEIRISPVPMKLAVVDHRVGLVPLRMDEPGPKGGLVLHPSPLLDGLIGLFEMVWERAVPVPQPVDGEGGTSRHLLSQVDERLLLLLGAGLKDAAIARQLGVGASTVLRRVRRMMGALSAQTRFQLGVQAALGGWITRED